MVYRPHLSVCCVRRRAPGRSAADARLAGLLPRGAAQLVEYFTSVCDHAFAEALDSKRDEFAGACFDSFGCANAGSHFTVGMRTQHRIAAAVRMRLEMVEPYIVSWAQALSLQARARAAAQHCIWH